MKIKEYELLCDLLDYVLYLEYSNKSDNWNKGYFRKLKQKLSLFCDEYIKNIE